MAEQTYISLERLREYGWSLWDPGGLAGAGGERDAYDPYLIGLVNRLRRGASNSAGVRYLMTAEAEAMGLSSGPNSRETARALVAAVKAYLAEFPDKPLEIR